MMVMTPAAAATTASAATNTSGLCRKLMKGLQTKNMLLKKKSPNQLKTALVAKKPLKMAQNSYK